MSFGIVDILMGLRMVFRFLLAHPGRLRVDADRALVGLNGREIARERGGGLCQFMGPGELCFPLSYISSPSFAFDWFWCLVWVLLYNLPLYR